MANPLGKIGGDVIVLGMASSSADLKVLETWRSRKHCNYKDGPSAVGNLFAACTSVFDKIRALLQAHFHLLPSTRVQARSVAYSKRTPDSTL